MLGSSFFGLDVCFEQTEKYQESFTIKGSIHTMNDWPTEKHAVLSFETADLGSLHPETDMFRISGWAIVNCKLIGSLTLKSHKRSGFMRVGLP